MPLFSKLKRHQGKVGGGFYFLSVISLLILAVLSSRFFLSQLVSPLLEKESPIIFHFCFVGFGILVAATLPGKFSVFIHELKHSIVSNLAGNSARGMKVEADSGHFEYAFSKRTAHLNAFISLAPYSFPLFSLISLLPYFLLQSTQLLIAKAILSSSLGIDLFHNFRDASPHQSDFSEVRGGFTWGMLYVICFNIIVACFITLFIIFNKEIFIVFGKWLFASALSLTAS